jgi:hypothetical protein
MKKTIDINDDLLQQVEQLAAKQQQTLNSILEAALEEYIKANGENRIGFRLRKHTFRGRGLHSDLARGDWHEIKERIYEGRGGDGTNWS